MFNDYSAYTILERTTLNWNKQRRKEVAYKHMQSRYKECHELN